jgi:hypothetical protein
VPFALGLTLGDLGDGANATKPEFVDPSPGLGELKATWTPALIAGQ